MSSSTYCVLPFIHLEITNAGGARPCCVSEHMLRASDGREFRVGHDEPGSIWRSEAMESLRLSLLRGEKPSNCARCWDKESLGIESKRQRDNGIWSRYTNMTTAAESPYWLDLKLGNLCNLKCRICGPYSSSKVAREQHELLGGFDLAQLERDMKWAEDSESPAWAGIHRWLAAIEHFDIYGGEPFLAQPHFALLERSVELGYSRRQTLHYNTNGTVFPRKMAEEIWPKFKSVNVMFSIDDVGPAFEYQRYPAKWEKVEENIRRFQEHTYLKLDVCYTVNAFNVWNFPEHYLWTRRLGLPSFVNYLYHPRELSAQIFSDRAKKRIESKLTEMKGEPCWDSHVWPILNFLRGRETTLRERETARQHVNFYDRHRGHSLREVSPDVHALLFEE